MPENPLISKAFNQIVQIIQITAMPENMSHRINTLDTVQIIQITAMPENVPLMLIQQIGFK